jgi:hypothetical protein
MEEKIRTKSRKFKQILLTLILIYTLGGIPFVNANSIEPSIRRITLAKGQRKYASVEYINSEDYDIELSITPYAYNPRTDDISEEENEIFLKADTDTITVNANSTYNIKYEIFPIGNIREGTYFNILTITPTLDQQDVSIYPSIAQLVILDVVNEDKDVKGIVTEAYLTSIQVVDKGIPFLKPLKLRYIIQNNSNYVLTPNGRIDIFNERNSYKPIYEYINRQEEEIYPNEILEKEFIVDSWHISDIFTKRIVQAQVYNGIDSNPQQVELEIGSFLPEVFISLTLLVITIVGVKYLRQYKKKNTKVSIKKSKQKPKKKNSKKEKKPV